MQNLTRPVRRASTICQGQQMKRCWLFLRGETNSIRNKDRPPTHKIPLAFLPVASIIEDNNRIIHLQGGV